jgi:NAD+ synthase
LNGYASQSKTNGFVVGISGGIDSALTSTLCAKTGLPTICVDMPILQNKNEVNRASNHIKWLQDKFDNVSHKSIDLNNVFETFKNTVQIKDNKNNFLSLANSRSRLRMTTLYYFAGMNNCLVAGTGNKVEDFGIGFYTKYGDGGVDISPIADLNKTDVFEISKILGVIDGILEAQPTDGLWDDGRTDEDQIGATYKELEWAMIQKDLNKKSNDFKGREKQVFEILTKLNKKNLHKMIPIPIYKVPKNLK